MKTRRAEGQRAEQPNTQVAVRGISNVPKIVIEGLSKSYGQKDAIIDVNLTIEPGTFLVLLGPSGSGKSTLLRCLAGIERPTTGTIRFDDAVVEAPKHHIPPERRNLAMVFQDYALWPHMTARQNVEFALQRSGVSQLERDDKVSSILSQVGLERMGARYPSQLSGGEQQRVGLARALVANPGILLFDEPLSNLDADRRERLRVDIGAMVRRHGASAIYITHDQAEAFALADVVGVLDGGHLIQVGTPEEVYSSPINAFVARFTGLAGELTGRLIGNRIGGGSQQVLVDVGGSTVIGKTIGTNSIGIGDRVEVLVRPSAVRFVQQPQSVTDVEPVDKVANSKPRCFLRATVLAAAFRGWGYEHEVELDGGFRLGGIPFDSRIPFMSSTTIELLPEGCLVVGTDNAEFVTPADDDSNWTEETDAEFLQYLTYGGDF